MSAALDTLVFRPATAIDAGRLAAVMAEGFEGYRSFAPDDYRPPELAEIVEILAKRLGTPPVWCLLAEAGADVAGYVSLLPATDSRMPVDDSALAHFWMLFVRPPWWGSGLAARLHAEACHAAAARGYTAMRLFTPAGQARARRFYEREGWRVVGEPFPHDELSFAMVEYRRKLVAPGG